MRKYLVSVMVEPDRAVLDFVESVELYHGKVRELVSKKNEKGSHDTVATIEFGSEHDAKDYVTTAYPGASEKIVNALVVPIISPEE